MTGLLLASLWGHLAGCVLLTGASFLLLLAGRPTDQATEGWEQRVLVACQWLAVTALVAGLVWFAVRVSIFTGRAEAALEPTSILNAATQTWPGQIWAIRHGLLAIVTAYLFLAGNARSGADWFASRCFIFALSAGALTLMSLSSHAAAISNAPFAHAADILHLLGAGIWIGALPPLAFLLFSVNRGRTNPHPFSLGAVSRFSKVALVAIFVIAGSGLVTASYLVGDIPGLIGTTHGRLLAAKIAVLIPALLLAAKARKLLAACSAYPAASRAAFMRRMANYIAAEAALVIVLLGFAAAMILSVPARHADPSWPLPMRYAPEAGVGEFVPLLSQWQQAAALAVAGCLSLGVVILLWRRKRALLASLLGGFALVAGIAASTGTLVEAYPTSFVRSPVPYDARSIASGRTIYDQECRKCARRSLADTVTTLTQGEMFWLTKDGAQEKGIPALGTDVDETDRWNVVNFMRALGAATGSPSAGPSLEPVSTGVRAVDFEIALGPLNLGTLGEYRKGRAVLLVLYSLPASQERMEELARQYARLSVLGLEIVAVQRHASTNPVAELQTSSPVLFPVVTEGNEEIAAAYGLFAPGASHVEMLIDRRFNIRTIWQDGEWNSPDGDVVHDEAGRLSKESPPADFDEHLH